MAQGSKLVFLALLLLASSASAATVGPVKGRAVTGRPLEVSIPFALDEARDRACASANVRYGKVPMPGMILDVQGSGVKRNLLVTSRANVNEQPVTIAVRIGCGAKAVTRRFVLPAGLPAAAKRPPAIEPVVKRSVVAEPATRRAAVDGAPKAASRAPVPLTPAEPLFPPPSAPEASPPEHPAPAAKADAAMEEELRKARTETATALAQLEATRKELAAVLDVVRRTSQTLINADHQVRDAESEVAHMRMVLMWVGVGLLLVAAGVVWWEFKRLSLQRFMPRPRPVEEPGFPAGMEMAT